MAYRLDSVGTTDDPAGKVYDITKLDGNVSPLYSGRVLAKSNGDVSVVATSRFTPDHSVEEIEADLIEAYHALYQEKE